MNSQKTYRLLASLVLGFLAVFLSLSFLSGGELFSSPFAVQPTHAAGGIHCVDDDGGVTSGSCTNATAYTTIQDAVNIATDGDEIRIARGTYTATGNNVVTITKRITIDGGFEPSDWSTSVSSTTTKIDGERARRGIVVQGSAQVAIANLMVTRGQADKGGGLYLENTSTRVTVSNAIFKDNESNKTFIVDGGGGIYAWGDVTLNRVEIISNSALKEGGGLYIRGKAILTETQVLSNTTGNRGGGLLSTGQLTVTDSLFKGNETLGTFPTSSYGGGGLWINGPAVLNGTEVVSNTTSQDGGGLYVEDGVLTMINTVIADNQANRVGSGSYIMSSTISLLHITIAHNIGGDGSGIHISDAPSSVAMTNTILVSHSVGITIAADNTATLKATLWGTGTWANDRDWAGDGTLITGTINIYGDPNFVDPENWNYHIAMGSAAKDMGVNAGVATDIDSDLRDCEPDIGADEYKGPPPYCLYLPIIFKNFGL